MSLQYSAPGTLDSRSLPIGVFDSGVGGLTVLKALETMLPHEDLLYLGDTARVPYGTRSQDAIERYTLMAAARLVSMGIKALVIACNTATSAALPAVVARYPSLHVIGVIEPGAAAAVGVTKNHCIAVIATEATISGRAYHKAIERMAPGTRIFSRACTLLVPLAEEGWIEGKVPEGVIDRYLDDIFSLPYAEQPDTLLLGCTHFPLFRAVLQKKAGQHVTLVDSATATATVVAQRLACANLLKDSSESGETCFFTTDHASRFARTGSMFLERQLTPGEIEVIDL